MWKFRFGFVCLGFGGLQGFFKVYFNWKGCGKFSFFADAAVKLISLRGNLNRL